jgi:hypothetical protein
MRSQVVFHQRIQPLSMEGFPYPIPDDNGPLTSRFDTSQTISEISDGLAQVSSSSVSIGMGAKI